MAAVLPPRGRSAPGLQRTAAPYNSLLARSMDPRAAIHVRGPRPHARRCFSLDAVAPSLRFSQRARPCPPCKPISYMPREAGSSAAAARGPRSPPGRTAMAMIRNTTTP